MAKNRLSQQVLLEVMVREIEELKEATGLVAKHYPEAEKNIGLMKNHVSRIESIVETGEVKVDMSPVRDVLRKEGEVLEEKLKSAQLLPNWLVITFLVGVILLATSLSANYLLYKKWKLEEQQKMEWSLKAKELSGEKIPK